MQSTGYTYLELARRTYSLIDEDVSALNTNNGYFNDFDVVFALELAERELWMRLARRSPVDFIRFREGVTYPAGAQTVHLEGLLDDGIHRLISVGYYDTSVTRYVRLRRFSSAQMYDYEPAVPASQASVPIGYLWFDKKFLLAPRPQVDSMALRFVYTPEPRRIKNRTETENLDVGGGFADAGSHPVVPSAWQHLIALRAACYLLGKRKDNRQEAFRADYKDALTAALQDAASRDVTEPPSGVDNMFRPPGGQGSDFALRDEDV